MPVACVKQMCQTHVAHGVEHGGTDVFETRIQRVEKLFEIEAVAVVAELLFIRAGFDLRIIRDEGGFVDARFRHKAQGRAGG